MNTATLALPRVAALGAGSQAGCFHCGEALPGSPAESPLDGELRRFCCEGCAAAASWIHSAQLDDYYRLRSDPAGRVESAGMDLSAWDEAELIEGESRVTPGGREITLVTDGMRCAACAWLIDRALAGEPGVIDAVANAVTGRIRLVWNPREQPAVGASCVGCCRWATVRTWRAAASDEARSAAKTRGAGCCA